MSFDKAKFPTAVGEALEKARHRVGFSIESASAAVGISQRDLGNIESGLRSPQHDVLKALARIYGVDHNRFGSGRGVPRVPPRYDEDQGVLWLGYVSITFDRAVHDNNHLLQSVGGAMRTMRDLDSQMPVIIRTTEFAIFADLLDLDDPELPQLLGHHLNVDSAHIVWLMEQLRANLLEAAV
jgi:transcriptional regulator with XRE-family HTH domain